MEIELEKTLEALVCGYVGRGVLAVRMDENDHLIFTMTDGTETDLGRISGSRGDDGRGIVSVTAESEPTAQPGMTDTYIITYTDGTTSRFQVYNGKDGEKGSSGDISLDTTLTQSGCAADAKAAGDAIGVVEQAAAAAQSTADGAVSQAAKADTSIGTLSGLTTGTKTNLVAAINEVKSSADTAKTSAEDAAKAAGIAVQNADAAQTTATDALTIATAAQTAATTNTASIGDMSALDVSGATTLVQAVNRAWANSGGGAEGVIIDDSLTQTGYAADAAAAGERIAAVQEATDIAYSVADSARTTANTAATAAATAKTAAETNAGAIGDLNDLDTVEKSSLVAAVNEVLAGGGGSASGMSWTWVEVNDAAVSANVYPADAANTMLKILLTDNQDAYTVMEVVTVGGYAFTEMVGARFLHNFAGTDVELTVADDGSLSIGEGDIMIVGLYYTEGV